MATTSETVELILRARDESAGAIDALIGRMDRLKGSIEGIGRIAAGNILAGLGLDALNKAVGGIDSFASGLIDANIQAQNLHATLQAVYGSATMANQAFNWIRQNEQKVPFDFQDIAVASTNVARFGGDITKVIPTLEQLGSIFRSTLGPTPLKMAAQAWQDMHAGLWRMMKRDLGVTQQDLASTGLAQFDSKNKFVGGDLDAALSAFVAKRYPDAIAQGMNTLTGALSSLKTQLFLFQQVAGQQVFGILQTQVTQLVAYLQANQGIVQGFAKMVGDALGGIAKSAISALPYVLSAVVFLNRAWNLIREGAQLAFNAIGPVVASFANWLQTTAFPAVEKVINALGNAWLTIYPVVSGVLQNLGNDFNLLVGDIADNAAPLMNGLAGAFTIGMGAVQATFGAGLDILSGNWAQFQNDFNGGVDNIITGAADLVAAFEVGFGQKIGRSLLSGFDWFLHNDGTILLAISNVFSAIIGIAATLASPLAMAFKTAFDGVLLLIKGFFKLLPDQKLVDLHVPGADKLLALDKQVQAMKLVNPLVSPLDAFSTGFNTQDKIFRAMGIGAGGTLGKNDHLGAGVSDAQFKADMEAARKRVVADMTGSSGGPVVGQTYDTSRGVGSDIMAQMKKLFAGLGGTMSFKDFLAAMGFDQLGKGKITWAGSDSGMPGPGGLPIPGAPGGTPGIGGIGAAAGSSLRSATGRVPLGALGATFMQTVATSAGIHAGTDPATRAAQQQASIAQDQYSEEQKHTTTLTNIHNRLGDVVKALENLAKGSTLPHPTPINALASHGVFRPNVG